MKQAYPSVRPSPIAGTWYSANPTDLQETVDDYIHNAVIPDLPGEVVAVVAPHAGYRYSGAVAGHAFKTILGASYDTIAVISPMHQYDPHPILTSAHRAYQTPLGEIPLATDRLNALDQALQTDLGINLTPIAYDQEHSLEIELPFLQRAIKGPFDLLPLMLRDQSLVVAKSLGEALGSIFKDQSFLLVASSDLSHFYPESKAKQLDQYVLSAVADFSPEGLFELKDRGLGHACGLAAIACVMWAAKRLGATDATVLSYDTSGSSTGDHSSVVGYGAAVITRPA